MKILVLGSEGQIGAPVCKYLESIGHRVLRYDIKRSSSEDLRVYDTALQNELFKNCDFIYYFASDVGGAKYLEKNQNSFEFIEDNILMMYNAFRLLKKYNKPFIFTSSQMAAQYHSTYGNLKLIGEKLCISLGGLYVRLWNVYGKEEIGDKSHVITDFINQAKNLNKITCRTDGEEERQFLHVDDLCEALWYLTQNYSNIDKSDSIDISNFEWIKIKDIANICSEIFNCEIIFSDRKDNTQNNYKNDAKKNILDFWQPKINIKEGILKLL